MNVTWIGSPNFWTGRPLGEPTTVVIHTMAGYITGCDDWFRNPNSQVSAHYGVGLNGDIHAYVRTRDRAWANGLVEAGSCWDLAHFGNPNHLTVSIETEDLGDPLQQVTTQQYVSVRTLVRTAIERHGISVLAGHCDITPLSRKFCPGTRWVESGLMEQLAAECGLSMLCS